VVIDAQCDQSDWRTEGVSVLDLSIRLVITFHQKKFTGQLLGSAGQRLSGRCYSACRVGCSSSCRCRTPPVRGVSLKKSAGSQGTAVLGCGLSTRCSAASISEQPSHAPERGSLIEGDGSMSSWCRETGGQQVQWLHQSSLSARSCSKRIRSDCRRRPSSLLLPRLRVQPAMPLLDGCTAACERMTQEAKPLTDADLTRRGACTAQAAASQQVAISITSMLSRTRLQSLAPVAPLLPTRSSAVQSRPCWRASQLRQRARLQPPH
jgi:hypothetical protein